MGRTVHIGAVIQLKYGSYGPYRSCNTAQIWIVRPIKYFQEMRQSFQADFQYFQAPTQSF